MAIPMLVFPNEVVQSFFVGFAGVENVSEIDAKLLGFFFGVAIAFDNILLNQEISDTQRWN